MMLSPSLKEPYKALSLVISCIHNSPLRVPPSTCKIICVKVSIWDRHPSLLLSRATRTRLVAVYAAQMPSTTHVLGKPNDSCVNNARRSKLHSLSNRSKLQLHPAFFSKISPWMTKSHRHYALINHKLKTKKMKNHRHKKSNKLL